MKIIQTSAGNVLLDDEDAKLLAGRSVYLDGKGYPSIWIDGKNVLVHRFILAAPSGIEVDHVNGNALDARRKNLRMCSRAENMRNRGLRSSNTSGFKGVSWSGVAKRWRAYLLVDGRQKHLGLFDSARDAATAHDAAAREHHKQFAWVNFPSQEERQAC